jgi:hypothetical protein
MTLEVDLSLPQPTPQPFTPTLHLLNLYHQTLVILNEMKNLLFAGSGTTRCNPNLASTRKSDRRQWSCGRPARSTTPLSAHTIPAPLFSPLPISANHHTAL